MPDETSSGATMTTVAERPTDVAEPQPQAVAGAETTEDTPPEQRDLSQNRNFRNYDAKMQKRIAEAERRASEAEERSRKQAEVSEMRSQLKEEGLPEGKIAQILRPYLSEIARFQVRDLIDKTLKEANITENDLPKRGDGRTNYGDSPEDFRRIVRETAQNRTLNELKKQEEELRKRVELSKAEADRLERQQSGADRLASTEGVARPQGQAALRQSFLKEWNKAQTQYERIQIRNSYRNKGLQNLNPN